MTTRVPDHYSTEDPNPLTGRGILLRRLAAGSLSGTILLACNIGVSFFMLPFLIHRLGDSSYGLWLLIGTFMGYYGLLDFGLSSAVSRFLSRAFGAADYAEMDRVINTSFFLFSILGLVAFSSAAVVGLLSPYILTDRTEVVLFRNTMIILGVSAAIGFPMRSFSGVLSAQARWHLIASIDLIKLAIRTMLIVYCISSGHGIISLALISLGVDLIGYGMSYCLVRAHCPYLHIRPIRPTKGNIRPLFDYSKYTVISQIADTLRFQLDSFVIAAFLNVGSVTRYSIGAKLVEYLGSFVTASTGIFSPIFSQFEARGDYESIRTWFLRATKFSILLSVFTGSSLIYYGQSFLVRWMGPDYQSSYYILVLLGVPAIVALMQNPSVGLLYGISKHRYYAAANICEGVLNLFLSLILVKPLGIYGVALGTTIEMLLFKLIVQPIYTCRVIRLSLYEYYVNTLLLTLVKVVSILGVYFYLVRSFLRPDYGTIILLGLIQAIVFAPAAFYFVVSPEERMRLFELLLLRPTRRGTIGSKVFSTKIDS